MALPEEMNTEQTMRRSDKILEAKSSFDTGFHREIRQKRENGVNPKTVMERLGHKNIETKLQTYIFNTDVMQQYAVDVFEKTINS